MTKEQRIALARIISDMIKADNIIEESEIKDMKRLMHDYRLTQQDMCDARRIKFSDAVNMLNELTDTEKNNIFEAIYGLSVSDNLCVPREALLLLALRYCLTYKIRKDSHGRNLPRPYLISCLTGESSLSEQYMIYLESNYDEERNDEVVRNFRLLVTQSKLCGFNFIYIPKLVAEFATMDAQYVKDVISYMAPDLDETTINNVYSRLCKMTTSEFFHSVLYERLQVHASHETPPSLLINIGTSVVPYCSTEGSVQYYTEFLCVPITSDTLTLVDELLAFYQSKVSIRQTITLNDGSGQFKYFGFYKALFDFLIAPLPTMPDLVFPGQDMHGRYSVIMKYPEGRERTIHLTPTEYNIYKEIVSSTFFDRHHGMAIGERGRQIASSITRIRGKLTEGAPDLTFPEQYLPERVGNLLRIRLKMDKVYVRNYNTLDRTQYEDISIAEAH